MARRKPTDFRSFHTTARRDANGKETRVASARDFEGYWWQAPNEEALHSAFWAAVESVQRQQDSRRAANQVHELLYGDRPNEAHLRAEDDKVTFNLVEQAVDTLCAKISKQKPKTTFVTDGGDWAQQRRAKRLEKYVDGTLYRLKAQEEAREEFRDACVYDVGVEKWFLGEDGLPTAERVHPEELLVDEVDGKHGRPRCMYQAKTVPREVLRAQVEAMHEAGDFGEGADAAGKRDRLLELVRDADGPADVKRSTEALGDVVEVREGWHLPSSKPKEGQECDGKHLLVLSNGILLEEEWRRTEFPFVVTFFGKRLRGFYGRGVAERLVKWQRNINKRLRRLNECLDKVARPVVLAEMGSEVEERHITNQVGLILKYRGTPPTFAMPPAVPPELFKSLEDDIRRGLEAVGVSTMDVAARKPAGLNSEPALREWSDIASERFALVGQAYEATFVARARQIMALSREAEEKGLNPEAPVEGRRGIEKVRWKEVAMDEEAFVLKALPTSSLPTTPAARKQTVEEWVQAGWIDGLTARRLMDVPDLEEANSVAFAGQEDIEYLVEDFLDGKDFEGPEPHQDLAYGLKRMQSAYLRAKRQGAPPEVRTLFLDWMSQAQAMLESMAAPAAPAGPQGSAMPPPGPAVSPPLLQ
jgi:hypothetical protein